MFYQYHIFFLPESQVSALLLCSSWSPGTPQGWCPPQLGPSVPAIDPAVCMLTKPCQVKLESRTWKFSANYCDYNLCVKQPKPLGSVHRQPVSESKISVWEMKNLYTHWLPSSLSHNMGVKLFMIPSLEAYEVRQAQHLECTRQRGEMIKQNPRSPQNRKHQSLETSCSDGNFLEMTWDPLNPTREWVGT